MSLAAQLGLVPENETNFAFRIGLVWFGLARGRGLLGW